MMTHCFSDWLRFEIDSLTVRLCVVTVSNSLVVRRMLKVFVQLCYKCLYSCLCLYSSN